jgi:hypothetical protein
MQKNHRAQPGAVLLHVREGFGVFGGVRNRYAGD